MVTQKTEVGFSGMLKGILSGIAVDLGFKPAVNVLPDGNNT
ncbi:MAG TPA: hypothetical protein P5052_03160 [Candidatus Paceibacterota bacterium]|nr:hypothetical protein [Candidatus Paceibacterota bacterium]